MTSTRPSAFRRFCAAAVAAALVLQPLGAFAVPMPITTSPLSETPLEGSNPVKPNIMFTLDDSGSMLSSMMPDYVGQAERGFSNSAFPKTGIEGWCLGSKGNAVFCALTSPPLASSNLNRIYYDPATVYPIGKRSDGSNLPCEPTDTPGNECEGPFEKVYTDGYGSYASPINSTTINLKQEYPDEVFCSTATPTAADRATAVTDGSVCRYNGVKYGGIGGYRYPSASFPFNYGGRPDAFCKSATPTGAELATASTDGSFCRYVGLLYPPGAVFNSPNPLFKFRIPRAVLTGNPYYYKIKSVRFCNTEAQGWGTGTCGPRWSTTNKFVSYGAGGFDPNAFERFDISPSDTAQMRNFARWYAFARTRILAMKTAGGIAFSALDDNSRVGFNTINTFAAPKFNFLNIKDFDASTHKPAWFTKFYSVVPTGETPTIDAMWRIGQYFSQENMKLDPLDPSLPPITDPLDAATGKCQSNFHLLATDGYANNNRPPYTGLAGPIANQDLTVPPMPPGDATGFKAGQLFPRPFREGTPSTFDTMADVAMYYWIHDLRPTLADKVMDSRAPWQHVNFYGLSLGAEGTLDYPSGLAAIVDGTGSWPEPVADTASAVDDLWHAAINGGGKYYNAQNAQQLAESIVSALADFNDPAGTGTAVGLAGAQLTATNSFGYRTSYETGVWGDVKKYALDPKTGALPVDVNGNPLANALVWSAAPLLDTMASGTGWDTNRRIVTIKDATGTAVPFRFANLSDTQKTSLNEGYKFSPIPIPTGAAVLNFLRGDKSNEGTGSGKFRIRKHILGDIVGSAAVPVGAPGLPYEDVGNPGYTAFASAKKTRTPTVYVGANDGMLHAFDDSTTANAGKETWAYVPKALFTAGDPNDAAHPQLPEFQLGALSFGGGIPLFKRRFYVNATPRVWDIDFANTNTNTPPPAGSNDWRTVLVGGLGAGARAVYALDVTTPVALTDSEATVASSGRVLWEFTHPNLGYVFDAPTLVKTKRYGWVVLVASGYNNPSGKGILYVLNPKNGTILKQLSPDVAADLDPASAAPEAVSDTDPRGLSTIRAFTASRKDPYVLQAYSGDLKGNIWRFDLSDPDESKWKVAFIAKLTDDVGNAQPITTGVRVEIDQNNNIDRYLFVGTGKLLHQSDLSPDVIPDTLYVIRDGTRTAAGPVPATPYSRADLNRVDATLPGGFTGAATGRGWYADAPDTDSKIITDVVADVQTVVWATSKPSPDTCDVALTSVLYARDYLTGNSVIQSAGGDVVYGITDIGSIAGARLIQTFGGASGATGDVRIQVTTTKGQVFSFGVKLTGVAPFKHRVSWRLLSRD